MQALYKGLALTKRKKDEKMNEKYIVSYTCADYAQYKRIMDYIAHDEHKRAKEEEREGTRLVIDTTNANTAARGYEENIIDKGRYGRGYEVRVREYLTGRTERVHAQGDTDIRFAHRSIEVKSSACWLLNPVFDSPESLQKYLDDTARPITRATYIIYAPITKDEEGRPFERVENISYVFTQKTFLQCLQNANMLQIKKRKNLFGLAVKQFYQSRKAEQMLFDALDASDYITLAEFKRFCEKS